MNIKSEKQHIFRKQYLFYDRSKWNEHKRILKEVYIPFGKNISLWILMNILWCLYVLSKQFTPGVHYEDKW